jgi:phenylacetate-CoA ligase
VNARRASLRTKLTSRVVFPLHELAKGHRSPALLGELERSQWLPRAELEQLRLRKLRGFRGDVSRNVPHFERTFRSIGFEPGSVRSLQDLSEIPFLDKPGIKENFDELKARDARSLRRMSTGGSTGQPLPFLVGRDRVSHDVAAKWRATRWWDVDIGDREMVLWGSPVELTAQDHARHLRDWVLRTRLLPAFDMSIEQVRRYVSEIRRFQPQMLFGYPSALAVLAERWVEEGGPRVLRDLRVIFCTGETLFPAQRELLEAAFGAPVANGYGSREAGFVAHQCPAGSLHISAEDVIVEIVGPDGQPVPTESLGEIVVTHLATRDFPFVRYRTGDIGSLAESPCTCGRTLPVLQSVQGRSTDMIALPGGGAMHGLALIYVLREMPEIAQFKIVQEEVRVFRVFAVAPVENRSALEPRIVTGFRARLGTDVTVLVEWRDHLPPERSGKYRYVVSLVGGTRAPTSEPGPP